LTIAQGKSEQLIVFFISVEFRVQREVTEILRTDFQEAERGMPAYRRESRRAQRGTMARRIEVW